METMCLAVHDASERGEDPERVRRWMTSTPPRGWSLSHPGRTFAPQRDGWPLELRVPGSGSAGEVARAMEDFTDAARRADVEVALDGQAVMDEHDPHPRGGHASGHDVRGSDAREGSAAAPLAVGALVVLGAGVAAVATGAVGTETVAGAASSLSGALSELLARLRP